MLLHWHLILSCLMLLWLCPCSAMCPSECVCRQTEKGKRKTSCTKGGMYDPIPTKEMYSGMEVLEISAPNNKWNTLTITPIFQNFKSLEEIHIIRSNVLQITMHAFWGVPSLKVLNLTFNNISGVSDHNFRGLVNLVELHLDDNKINRIQSGAFRHLTELRILTLERNNIEEIVPRVFLKLGKLQVLKLSGNYLQELHPEVFKDILELRVLECRGCGLRRINTQIYHLLPYLAHLDLGDNRMQFIASDEFRDLHRLHSLHLDGNQLPVVLEKTFVNQHQMRSLCLARNRLAKITNTAFLNLTNLVELDISYNKLDKMEGASLQHISETLEILLLSGNKFPLSVLRVALQVAHNVRVLEIADMGIRDLPSSFLPDRLQRLNVSGNNLTELRVHALPQQLVELDISRNKFQGLEEGVVLRLEQLKKIVFNNNPWACDLCHITPLVFRLNKSSTFQNLVCASPTFHKGRLLSSLELEDITNCGGEREKGDSGFWFFIERKLSLVIGGMCLLVFLIFCVIFVVCSCMRRRANAIEELKRTSEREVTLENSTVIFAGKGEISFKFPLDLTERKVSVSTIDEIKKDTQLHTLPNGTGIGI